MLQKQLGNKPKCWDRRGVAVQADPKTRQYKVMAFGSRRLTLRNRRFLRKHTPINSPPGTPTGLTLGMRLGGQSPVQSTPPLTNAPMIPAPVSNQRTACTQYSLPPAPEPVVYSTLCPDIKEPEQNTAFHQCKSQHSIMRMSEEHHSTWLCSQPTASHHHSTRCSRPNQWLHQ